MKQKRYTEEEIALALRQAEGSTTVASLAQFGRPTPPLVQSANERWSMDFMSDSLVDGRRFRVLTLVDDFSVGLNPPPLAVDPGRCYRLGEKCNRLFPLGKPHGAYELRRKSPCTIGRVYRTFGEDCKYHVVIVPNYQRRALYGKFRRNVGEILRDLCRQRGGSVGRDAAARPCAYVSEGGPEIQHRVCDRLSEGEECSADSPGVDAGAVGEGVAFLVEGVLCEHGRDR